MSGFIAGNLPGGGAGPYGKLKTSGLPGGQELLEGAHPISDALFRSLVKRPAKKVGVKPKIPGASYLGLPFNRNGSAGGIGGGKNRQPMFGGISHPGYRE